MAVDLEQCGRRLMVEPEGTELSDREKSILEELKPPAIMFRARNFLEGVGYEAWLDGYQRLYAEIASCIDIQKTLVCLDHEGEHIIRFPEPITRFPFAGKTGLKLEDVARATALELKAHGVNMITSPVVDVNSNPDNPIIGGRAFGNDVDTVIKRAGQFYRILTEEGVITCLKHFPGHGDTATDSHVSLPVLDFDLDELRKRELAPFKAFIDTGVPAIMNAHIMLRNVDPEYPSSLSLKMMKDVLRHEFGFEGLSLLDAVGMDAIREYFTDSDRGAVQCINATVDIITMVGPGVSMETALKVAKDMQNAISSGEASEDLFFQSLERINNICDNVTHYPVSGMKKEQFESHHALAREVDVAWSDIKAEGLTEGI